MAICNLGWTATARSVHEAVEPLGIESANCISNRLVARIPRSSNLYRSDTLCDCQAKMGPPQDRRISDAFARKDEARIQNAPIVH